MEELPTFSGVIAQTIEALEADPADTARQMAIVGAEAVGNNHDLVNRIRRDSEDVGLEEALAAEARLMLAGAGNLVTQAYGSEQYEEATMRARGVGLMLDEMAEAVRAGYGEAAQTMREEIETALDEFGRIVAEAR